MNLSASLPHNSVKQHDVLLHVHDLHKSFFLSNGEEYTVLKGINFTLSRGEFVALMGPSGSGKSTLLNILGALIPMTRGQVFVVGKPLHELKNNELTQIRRYSVGWVFQDFNLIENLTALENVLIPMNLAGITGNDAKNHAMQLLRRVGLEDRAHHFPSSLSGGQQQRVAIARAMANNPPILLADEPTGNLDTKTSREIIELFKELASSGVGVLMVTHDIEMANAAQRIYVLQNGRLAKTIDGVEI